MHPSSPPLAAEVKMIRVAYAALNRNDIDGFVENFDPHVERIEPADFPMAGTYHGLAAVRTHVAAGRGTWTEGACTPTRFITDGKTRVIAVVDIHVRLHNATDWITGQIGDAFTFRDGHVVQFQTFGSVAAALAWAGIDDLPQATRTAGAGDKK